VRESARWFLQTKPEKKETTLIIKLGGHTQLASTTRYRFCFLIIIAAHVFTAQSTS
jgi:hypothetical protein